jgi:hypothetical protein
VNPAPNPWLSNEPTPFFIFTGRNFAVRGLKLISMRKIYAPVLAFDQLNQFTFTRNARKTNGNPGLARAMQRSSCQGFSAINRNC